MTSSPIPADFLKSDWDDQRYWKACIGLDLADRTVLEAEVLIWRIVQQMSGMTHQCPRSWDRS
jgi:hypothetical protein